MDTMSLARDERAEFADFLTTLTPDQWDTPSLCDGWRVRDVVAHVISYEELSPRALLDRAVKGRFWPSRMNAVGLAESRTRSPEELIRSFRRCLTPRGLTAQFGGAIALTDALIHHQDVRRPLGLHREVPAERLRRVLPFAFTAPLIRGFWRARGLRLVATDVDWSTGRGPEVSGPGEALVLAMAGRRGVVGELSGPGQPTLAGRIGA